jgi:hypothetical protein
VSRSRCSQSGAWRDLNEMTLKDITFIYRNTMAQNPISNLLANPKLVSASGPSLHWNGVKIERQILKAVDWPSEVIDQHYLMLWEQKPFLGEMETRPGSFLRFRKFPGTITMLTPDICSAVQTREDHVTLVCSLPPRFLHNLELEMDRRPNGLLQPLHVTDDSSLRELMYRLMRGTANGRGYNAMGTESLLVELGFESFPCHTCRRKRLQQGRIS